jgi:hypothetical protein
MKLNELIENLERGLDRAEEETWIAFAIEADDEAKELLEDLQRVQKLLSDNAQNEAQ